MSQLTSERTGFEYSHNARLIHLHIPKTAGTTLRRILDKEYGAKKVLFYDNVSGRVTPNSRRVSKSERGSVNAVKGLVHRTGLFGAVKPIFTAVKQFEAQMSDDTSNIGSRNFSALSGHFSADDLKKWGLAGEHVISVLRDPLERSMSQYQHWKRVEGLNWILPYDPDINFTDFSLDPTSTNLQSRYLGDLAVTTLGIQEALPAFLESAGLTVPRHMPHMNTGNYNVSLPTDKGFLQAFEAANLADYELYEQTRDRYQ